MNNFTIEFVFEDGNIFTTKIRARSFLEALEIAFKNDHVRDKKVVNLNANISIKMN